MSADSVFGVGVAAEPSAINVPDDSAAIAVVLDTSVSVAPVVERDIQQSRVPTGHIALEQTQARREMVFIDASVDNYEQLVGDLLSQHSNERQFDVRILDAQRDGIKQISEVLAEFGNLDAVHFISHAIDGAVQLGATWLDIKSLHAVAGSIAGWRGALSENADLLFYGCDLAASGSGVILIEQLTQLTGAEIAASVDRTGAAVLGGDWQLELAVGHIQTKIAPSWEMQQKWSSVLAAPTASNMNAAETYTLNTPLNLADIVINDVDGGNVTATLTLSDRTAGSLSTGTSGSVTSAYNAVTGVWTVSGAIADVNVLLANLTYTPSLLYLLPFTISTSVSDGVDPAITGSKSMTVSLLNLPPSASNLNAAESYTEDTPLNLTDIVVSDLDSANVTARLTLSNPAAGSLSTSASGSVISTFNAATGVWSASGPIANVNALLAGVTFNPAADFNGNFTISTRVDDGVAPAITGVKSITGIAVNDAPMATNLNAAETYTEDTSLNLADIVVSDVDSASVAVTLTLSDSTAGTLSTATSGSVTSTYNTVTGVWSASGIIADVNALLANVTFTPAANYNSDFTIATSVDDGIAPAITGVKSITGIVVNDAPLATNLSAPESYSEDTALNLTDILITDPDGGNVTATLTLSNSAAGTLSTATSGLVTSTYNGMTGVWSASGPLADVNVLLANLTFTPAANYNSNFTIATNVDDGLAPALTGMKNISGTAQNDAPVLTTNTLTITEGGSVVLSGADLSASDVDDAAPGLTFTVSSVIAGQFEFIVSPGVGVISFTQAQVNGGEVRFVHDGGEAAPSYEVSVSDGLLSTVPAPATIIFTNQNDSPTATNLNAVESYTEDNPLDLTNIVISDIDSANVTATLTLSDSAAGSLSTGTSGSVTSTYNAGTGLWTASGAIVDVNALLANVTFTPAANYNSNFIIATSVDDGVAPAITGVKNITGISVNDAPIASNLNAAETYTLNTPLDLADVVVSDVDSAMVTVTLTLSDVGAGSLNTGTSGSVTSTYNAGTGVWTASGAIADVNELLANLTYSPTLLYLLPFTIDTSVDDGVAPAVTGSKAMTMGLVNLPPFASNLSTAETYTEDTPHNLTNIVVTDLDSPNVTATLTLSDPTAGSLNTGTSGSVIATFNTSTGVWTASGAIGDVNALLAAVTFTPAANYSSNFTIDTSIEDGVAPAITGVKNMTGIAVNDTPLATNLNASESYTEDSPVNLTDIVIADPDGNVTATLTLSDSAAGILSTATSGSVTSTFNAVTGVWTASGAVSDVNALLTNVTFNPAANYNSNFTIATSVDDGIATALTGVKNIIGTAQNDAPVLTTNTLTISEGGSVILSSSELAATDVDDAAASLRFSVSAVTGGQFELVASPGIAITNFTQAQVSGGEVRFVHDGGEAAPSYDVTVSDGFLATTPAAATMSFTNQNDAPVLANNTLTITEGGSVVLSSANVSAVDVDDAAGTLTFSVSAVTGGQFELVASPGVAITTFTQAQVSGGQVRFLHDGGEAAPSYDVSVADAALSVGPTAAVISFSNQNDSPTASNLNAAESYSEDIPFNLTNIVVSDVDSASVTVTLTVSDSGAGVLSTGTSGSVTSTYNGVTGVWSARGAIGDVNTLLSDLTFTPAANYNGNFTINTSVDDGVAAAITGVKNITGSAINDAPVATNLNAPENYTEDTPLNLTHIVVSDVDSTNVTATLSLSDVSAGSLSTATSGSVTSTYNPITGVWTASGVVSDVNALLANVAFTPAANYDNSFTIATSVSDGVAPAVTGTKNIIGTAQNDAPVLTTNTLTITEGGSVVLSGSKLAATDVDDAAASLTFSVSAVTAGQFELVASPGIAITNFTQAQVSAGAVRFVHDGGEAAPSYDVTITDTTLSVGPAGATISFTNQNDAPTFHNNRLNIDRGGSVVISGGQLSATDSDNVVASLTFTVSAVSGGRFEFVTSPGVAITTFTQAEISGGAVRFVHDGGTAAPSYDVTVFDGALSVGPVAATINFRNPQEIVEVIPPPPPVVTPGGTIVTEEPTIVDGGQVNPIPPSVPITTGAGGITNPSTPSTRSAIGDVGLSTVANTSDFVEVGDLIAVPSRMFSKPPSEIQDGISARTHVPFLSQNSELEEATANTIDSGDPRSVIDVRGFVKGLDALRDEVTEENFFEKVAVGSALSLTTGLSIGYFIWLIRGEILLSSLLASLPAWRFVDPLPVLASIMKNSKEDGEDDESIEEVVKKGGEIVMPKPVPNPRRGSRSVKWRMVMQPLDPVQESNS